MRIILIVIGTLLGLACLAIAGGLWTYFTAPFFGMVQAERQLESGPSRIGFYDQFFNLCAGVQAIEGQIASQEVLLASLDKGNSQYVRTQQNIAGLKGRRQQVIAQYNANATKDYTAARFHDADLPFTLSPAAINTKCAK